MRLREISSIIGKSNLSSLSVTNDSVTGGYKLKKLDDFRKSVNALSGISAFDRLTQQLLATSVFQTGMDEYIVDYNEKILVEYLASTLKSSASGLKVSIEDQLINEKIDSVSIKLPEETDLKSIITDLSTIEKSISQVVVNDVIDGRIEVNTWEPGSLWIEIYLGTAAATSLVGSIAWAAVVIRKKIAETKIIEEHLRGLIIKNDGLDSLLAAQVASVDLQIESEAKALDDEYFSDSDADPERILRLQFAIKQFSKLIDRGAEVHPALSAPESVKNLFPSAINPLAIESRIRRIENLEET